MPCGFGVKGGAWPDEAVSCRSFLCPLQSIAWMAVTAALCSTPGPAGCPVTPSGHRGQGQPANRVWWSQLRLQGSQAPGPRRRRDRRWGQKAGALWLRLMGCMVPLTCEIYKTKQTGQKTKEKRTPRVREQMDGCQRGGDCRVGWGVQNVQGKKYGLPAAKQTSHRDAVCGAGNTADDTNDTR